MRKEYISASGKPITYEYCYRESNHKPKCLNCNRGLNNLYFQKNGKREKIGYFCKHCKTVFIYKKYPIIIRIKRMKQVIFPLRKLKKSAPG